MNPVQKTSFAAMLGRWQPVHLGHRAALISLCEQYDRVVVGIGSSNIHDYRNPFSQREVEDMLNLVLAPFDNFTLIPIPDQHDDAAWCRTISASFGRPDVLFTANPYVAHLLKDTFALAHPASVIPAERKTAVSATMVRRALARGADWQPLLPGEVAAYIRTHRLDDRFRRDFGLQTLMMETVVVNY